MRLGSNYSKCYNIPPIKEQEALAKSKYFLSEKSERYGVREGCKKSDIVKFQLVVVVFGEKLL